MLAFGERIYNVSVTDMTEIKACSELLDSIESKLPGANAAKQTSSDCVVVALSPLTRLGVRIP